MTEASLVLAVIALGASILFIVALVVMALLTHHGRRRAAIIACALPLGLVPLALIVSYGSRVLINTFSGMALSSTGGMAAVTGECQRVWSLVRMGSGGFVRHPGPGEVVRQAYTRWDATAGSLPTVPSFSG